MVSYLDLNFPPVHGGTSTSTKSWIAHNAVVSVSSQPGSTAFNKGSASSPIDVDALDDDDDDDVQLTLSGLSAPETTNTLLSLNNSNYAERMPSYWTIVKFQLFSRLKKDHESKRRRKDFPTTSSYTGHQTPPLAPPKEPTLKCPVCLDSLRDPCSTVCGHIYCQVCIESALKRKKECPTCKIKLHSRKKFHRIYLPNSG